LGNGPPKKLSERRPRHPEENMAIGEVYKLYKLWRESQRIKELSEKTVGIINRVDQLFRDYAEWQSNKSEERNRSANCKAGGGPFHAERLGVKVASG
jgi:hypothetical protein